MSVSRDDLMRQAEGADEWTDAELQAGVCTRYFDFKDAPEDGSREGITDTWSPSTSRLAGLKRGLILFAFGVLVTAGIAWVLS
jgi:hypothetical protein